MDVYLYFVLKPVLLDFAAQIVTTLALGCSLIRLLCRVDILHQYV